MEINFIYHLTCFFFMTEQHQSMRPTHISLYIALFRLWNTSRFCETMSVSRTQMMKASKIGSKTCYYRSLKELHEWGYRSIFHRPVHGNTPGSR